MDYLIGSLDGDGLLRKDLAALSDEIAVHEYIDVSTDELERVLTILQGFDPPGIGAQSLQQCLQIQILRKNPTPVTKLMHEVVSEHWTDFARKHWKRIAEQMQMGSATAEEVFAEIRRLNPRPGAALGETMGRSTEQLTPDFVITIDDDENIQFAINRGQVPELHVSREFEDMIDAYRQNPSSMTRTDKEGLLYAQQKVSKAKAYIDAMKQRQQTMALTMKTIISLQRKFILSGDESDLVPMKLKDIADRTNMDMSTVSRVCASKYAEMPWGIIQLKSFFSEGYDTGDGETVSTKEIKKALKELIDNEPQGKPLSDIRLAAELKKMGYPIARRTVAKYREKLGIPTSNLRR
jgi:RNA polymerase sigma-54 factor